MANVTSATAKLTGQIVGIHREKRLCALAVRVTRGFDQNVITVERKLRVQAAAKANEQLFLMKLAAAFELIDFPSGRIRSGRKVWWQRRINVTRANHVQNANRISSHRHGEVMRQLALDLSAGNIDRGHLQIWDDR